MDPKCEPKSLYLEGYDNSALSENEEESTDKEESIDLFDIPPIEGDEEVKEEKGLKILTPNKLLTRIPILSPQIGAGNSSCKLKNEIRKILYLLYQHIKIIKKVYDNLFKSL